MNIKKRIEQIENNMISKDTVIPPGKETIVFYPDMYTEEEKKIKISEFLNHLRETYGENISRRDINVISVVYDEPPTSKEMNI
jgi:hypothetical protein